MTEEYVRNDLAKFMNRHKEALRGIRCPLTNRKIRITNEMKSGFRMRYFNVKAIELMLENGIYQWTNGKCEDDIIEQCRKYNLVPDLIQWDKEWIEYAEACENLKAERIRKIEEQRINVMKMQHKIQIKLLKLQAMLNTIKFHDAVKVSISKNFDIKPEKIDKGVYMVHFSIEEGNIELNISYNQVDTCITKILELLNKINTLVPDFINSLAQDKETYRIALGGYFYGYPINGCMPKSGLRIYDPFDYKGNKKYTHLSSYKVLTSINEIFDELQDFLIKDRN